MIYFKNLKLIFIFVLLLSSCAKKKDDIVLEYKAPFDNQKLIDSLIDQSINKGNEKAYCELSTFYLVENMETKLFYYSFLMANKNNTPYAFKDVFYILKSESKDQDINNLDNQTKNMALAYLLKAYELGDENAKYEVFEIFGEKKIPKSKYYFNKLSECLVLKAQPSL